MILGFHFVKSKIVNFHSEIKNQNHAFKKD
jgi:hypothetical protein